MKRYRMGIIGCGWAGEQHARAIALLADRVEICAVADSRAEIAQARAGDWQAPWWTSDYRKLLSRPLDAVSICLPHSLHAPATIAAARAGLHILVEKPLATTLAEADSMISAADEASVILMVAETVRFSSLYIKAAEIVQAGALGDVFLIRIAREHQMHDYLRRRPWFLQETTGGIMYSGGIHDFEILRMLGGDIEHVYAIAAPKALPEMAADDTSVALAGMSSGASAVIVESFSLRTPNPGVSGSIHGSGGSLWFGDGPLRLYTANEDGHGERVQEIEVPTGDTFEGEMAHFLDCLDSKAEPLTSGREERQPLAAVCAAYRSMEQGRRVYLAEM